MDILVPSAVGAASSRRFPLLFTEGAELTDTAPGLLEAETASNDGVELLFTDSFIPPTATAPGRAAAAEVEIAAAIFAFVISSLRVSSAPLPTPRAAVTTPGRDVAVSDDDEEFPAADAAAADVDIAAAIFAFVISSRRRDSSSPASVPGVTATAPGRTVDSEDVVGGG